MNGSEQSKVPTIARIHYISTESTMDLVFGTEHSVGRKQGFIINGLTVNGLGCRRLRALKEYPLGNLCEYFMTK